MKSKVLCDGLSLAQTRPLPQDPQPACIKLFGRDVFGLPDVVVVLQTITVSELLIPVTGP